MQSLDDITSYIHEHIPMTRFMGARVESFRDETVTVSTPLQPNLNHRNTAFGGSIATLAILSGWTLLHLKMKNAGIKNRLVIQNSSVDFTKPIDEDFKAICTLTDQSEWEKFISMLEKYGKARITVQAKIECASQTAGYFTGTYVAIKLN